ncbi:MAG: PIG-L family deacetylase [Candidatus Omnitrophica bacterium]|nr:PIG-L family deacetylase [Candidatus Omnitrophota bacterium]
MAEKNIITLYYMSKRLKLISLTTIFICCLSTVLYAEELKIGNVSFSPVDRVLVLAPHPDDEVLGTGGVIQQAVALKLPLKIVFFTYGDSNQWSFLLYRKHPVVMPGAVESMGLVRHDEAVQASRILGVPPDNLTFLGYPDFGTLNIWYYHWKDRPAYRSLMTRVTQVPYKGAYRPGALYKGEEIVRDLRAILKEFKPTKIFVSHPADHNGDHLALYLYLRVALWDEGMEGNIQLYPYLIHYLGWPKPKAFHPDKDLIPPEGLASGEIWQQFRLSESQFQTKIKALQAHSSQYRSSPKYLLSFVKYNELFGDFPLLRLHLNENSSIFSSQRKFVSQVELPEELNDRERLAFIGVDWKFMRRERDNLIVSIKLSKPLAQDVEASIYFFGYNNKRLFDQMPKINVRLGVLSYSVYDQNKRLEQGVVSVKRTPNDVIISVPLELLGFPQKILTSARTSLGNFPLDTASWVAVELQ